MQLNDDFSVRAVVHGARLDWAPSPASGVHRRMLFRIGEEKARATSIVRYAPDSHFPRHAHPGGEEFLVLEGTFQDETGDFPTGTYVRNPPTSAHAPGSDGGCTIFVKLWQFREDDRERVITRPGEGRRMDGRSGVLSSTLLFESPHEQVMVEEWEAGAEVDVSNARGLELLVVEGSFADEHDALERLSWMRLPAGMDLRARVGPDGAKVWWKSAKPLLDQVCEF